MGRGKFKKGGRGGRGGRGGGGGHRGGGNKPDNRVSFDQVPKQNEKFERFYNTLDIVPEGTEREAFWTALRRELPNAFRFTGSKGHAQTVRKNLTERFFPLIEKIRHNGEPVELPKEIPWYPESLAYSMTTPKNVVRKYEPFKEFQRFLVSETGVGNISRQEQVSMIPPLLLDIKPHHTVLDLCAAPGSKSAQLIEAIHAGEEERVEQAIQARKNADGTNGTESSNATDDNGRSTGLLVANDVNYARAQMLVHQVKRLNSPNLIVTNHDATMFPSIELPPIVDASKEGKPPQGLYLKFDRVLADVPCSGDGTARKNPNIWKDWTPVNALGLYITQVRILVRALQMLKAGGRVVYSTCSLNPIENEAVVASAIERCGGVSKVHLVDCSKQLPELKRVHGLTDWSVMARSGEIYESWPEAEQFEGKDSKVVPGMFPPEPEEQIPLDRCMRVYPHQQDTGGFFIAVLEKEKEIRAKSEHESKSGNKSWIFKEPEKAPVTALVTEMQQTPTDGSGHAQHLKTAEMITAPAPGELAADNATAAQRSNEAASELPSVVKRKAEDDLTETNGSKRFKIGDSGEEDAEANGATPVQKQHIPLPPSVQQGLDADDATRALSNSDDGTVATVGVGAAADAPVGRSAHVQPAQRRRRGDDAANEEAFKYLSPSHAELEIIYAFYQLHPSFPRDRFLVRNPAGDPVKGIYYSSQLVKEILVKNEGRGMKFVHAGVKMFMKQDAQGQQNVCRWRIQTEGLPIVEGWVGDERTVRLWKRSTLRKLLVEMFPKLSGPPGEEGWRALGEIGEQVKDLQMGCCVIRVSPGGDPNDTGSGQPGEDEGFDEPLTLPLWKSLHSLNLMLPKEERKALLLRLYNEEVELVNNSQPKGEKRPNEQDQGNGLVSGEKEAGEVKQLIDAPDDSQDAIPTTTSGPLGVDGEQLAPGAPEETMDVDGTVAQDDNEARALASDQDATMEEDTIS